jgi:hypothetical protein
VVGQHAAAKHEHISPPWPQQLLSVQVLWLTSLSTTAPPCSFQTLLAAAAGPRFLHAATTTTITTTKNTFTWKI